jgi:hypothetical protein
VRRAHLVVPALTALAAVLLRFTPVYDPDAFWHLATGRWIVAHRAIPTVDTFSHTARGQPLRFVDALADLTLYGAWSLGGYGAVSLLAGLLGALTVWICLRHKRFDAALVTAAPLLAAVIFRVTPRPQTFGLPCFAAVLACLDLARRDPRWLRALPALVALWQNLHPSAPMGLAAVGITALGESWRRRRDPDLRAAVTPWWMTTLACALALLLTPRPLDRLSAGFGHVSDVAMAEIISEWAPLYRYDFATAYAQGFYALAALALVGAFARRDAPWRAEVLTLAALTTVQGVRAVRFVPFAAVALAPLALRGAEVLLDRLRPTLRPIVAGVFALALGLRTVAPQTHGFGAGLADDFLPTGAARFLAARGEHGRLFNEFTFGGYLLWTLSPAWTVFLDGRSMALYPPRFVDEVLRTRTEGMRALVQRHDVSAVVHRTSSVLAAAQGWPGWSVVYVDDTAFVAVRDDAHPALARSHGMRVLTPGDWARLVTSLRGDPSRLPAARAELLRLAHDAPGTSLIHVLAGAVALGAGDFAGAERELQRALEVRPESVPARRARLMACVLREDRGCVCERVREVRAVAPQNPYAREVAQRFGCAAR